MDVSQKMKSAAILPLCLVVVGCSQPPKPNVVDKPAPVAQESARTIQGVYEGDTIDIALGKFRDDYFSDIKEKTKIPHHGFTMISESEREARVRFYVYYAIWGYDEELILEKKEGKWVVSRRENFRNLDF